MNNLEIAKQKYPQGTLFFSATGNLRTPTRVDGRIRYGIANKENIYVGELGILFDQENGWAEIVKLK